MRNPVHVAGVGSQILKNFKYVPTPFLSSNLIKNFGKLPRTKFPHDLTPGIFQNYLK